uniref:AlNc14C795G12524 protein n=1 Tax=Albugo laibachii Nc14 TaxID=890382 RepID=F0X226_9STRA|nr:AlNc14C795G12524 [Albugo laibachii Nc14]|eukprot:CCA27891.1 AlNc14C795G12524 [Albugo laibachii Nc14]
MIWMISRSTLALLFITIMIKVRLYFFIGSKCEKLSFLFQFVFFLHVVFCVLLFCHEISYLNSAFKNEKLKKKIEKNRVRL